MSEDDKKPKVSPEVQRLDRIVELLETLVSLTEETLQEIKKGVWRK